MKRRIVAGVLALTLLSMLTACGGGSSSGSNSNSNTSNESVAETEEQTSDDTTEESTVSGDEGDLGDYHVKINDATFDKDYEGNPMIVIHYDFTNNSDDSQSALFALSSKAYQDGVELETAMALNDDAYDAGIAQKDIKPGVTIEDCQIAYTLTSESPVEFEVSELMSFSDDKLEKTFDVQQ